MVFFDLRPGAREGEGPWRISHAIPLQATFSLILCGTLLLLFRQPTLFRNEFYVSMVKIGKSPES